MGPELSVQVSEEKFPEVSRPDSLQIPREPAAGRTGMTKEGVWWVKPC